MRIEGVVQEAAMQTALLGMFTLVAEKTSLINKFPGTNSLGIFYPLPFDVLAVIGASIIHEEAELKPQNAIILKNLCILSVSIMTSSHAYFMGDTVQLPISSSLKLGLVKTVIVSYSAIPFLFKRLSSSSYEERNRHWCNDDPYFEEEPWHDPYFHEPRNPEPRHPQQNYRHYSGNITIHVSRANLTASPKPHIRDFSSQLSAGWNNSRIPSLSANFNGEAGIDAGGVRRDFCDSLFDALSKDTSLFQGTLPHATNSSDIDTFKHMGIAFMYFYQVNTTMEPYNRIQTGSHYSDNLFEAALALTAGEIDTPFNSLSNAAKLRVARILTPESYPFFSENLTNEMTVDYFNEAVAPVHALAQGMKSKCHLSTQGANPNTHWDRVIKPINFLNMSIHIQGSQDRTRIADAFTTHEQGHIQTKVTWLKEWIRNDATDLEVKQLLKFATGTSSLAEGRGISVYSEQVTNETTHVSENKPFPIAHTCGPSIGLSPQPCELDGFHNRTKEGFIRCIKLAIIGDAAFTQG